MTNARRFSPLLAINVAALLSSACAVTPGDAASSDDEASLACTDCDPGGASAPSRPASAPKGVRVPWARAVRPGPKVDVKVRDELVLGLPIYVSEETTTFVRTDDRVMQIVGISKYGYQRLQFYVAAVGPNRCRIDAEFHSRVDGFTGISRHAEGFCYNLPHDDESAGNNGGYELVMPEQGIKIWAKREDRIRIWAYEGVNKSNEVELDLDEG